MGHTLHGLVASTTRIDHPTSAEFARHLARSGLRIRQPGRGLTERYPDYTTVRRSAPAAGSLALPLQTWTRVRSLISWTHIHASLTRRPSDGGRCTWQRLYVSQVDISVNQPYRTNDRCGSSCRLAKAALHVRACITDLARVTVYCRSRDLLSSLCHVQSAISHSDNPLMRACYSFFFFF